ncbi:pentapeptide repeat-containing protein [Phototrophicus methaneseepsis]|uniref:Pentapeptide repeat-containing protein n=1 Tax=Phototrophicus methaneseepsis TaxID=2710758 RepID=A0A7S8E619_9CHLR|nr:pentapeptide repeat-containing protein [Phototrophicus methaneseepsis]QPC80929.1 pentapeptide repeat-containing protein [Phototrophicus methaneseepsis]
MLDWLVWPFRRIKSFAKFIAETYIGYFFRSFVGRVLLSVIYVIVAIISFSLFPELEKVKLLDGLTTELLGVLFVFLVIDYYRESEAMEQQERRKKEALLDYKNGLERQARSRNNNNALDAIDIIREEGWLDGSTDTNLLEDVNLASSDLTGANLREARLSNTDLSNSNLTNADLRGADLTNTKFINAKLVATLLVGSKLHDTDFTKAKLFVTDKVILEEDEEICRFKPEPSEQDNKANFTSQTPVIFRRATLSGKKVKRKKQQGEREELIYMDLSDLDLSEVCFEEATLQHVDFSSSILKKCNFSRATLMDIKFTGTTLSKATFTGIYEGTKDTPINFSQAVMDEVVFNGEFVGVDFTAVQTFKQADSRNAVFSEADFSGATMSEMRVSGATFSNVIMDKDTVLFDDVRVEKYWFDCCWNSINQQLDVQELDFKEVREDFNKKLGDLARRRTVKRFTANILKLPLYKIEPSDEVEEATEASYESIYRYRLVEEKDKETSVEVFYEEILSSAPQSVLQDQDEEE